MLLFSGTLALIAFGVWLYCLIDTITSPADQVRNLPKIAWVFIVILLMEIGAVAWLIAGRPRGRTVSAVIAGQPPARRSVSSPDDDEEFLASLRRRTEEQRRRAREQQPPTEPTG